MDTFSGKHAAPGFAGLVLLTFLMFSGSLMSETLRLHVPIVTDSQNLHRYFHELLTKALDASGHKSEIIVHEVPHLRAKALLQSGELSIFWMVASMERNRRFQAIPVDITNNLIGKRILLIPEGEQAQYDGVNNLIDFRGLALKAGFGEDWFDTQVWQANQLDYAEHSGNWESIFKMVALGRAYDYFPRGLNEILTEAKRYPDLQIEQNLVLIYRRDFVFYLSRTGPNAGIRYAKELNAALKQARDSGLIRKLVRKYWSEDIEALNYEQRTKIYLNLPEIGGQPDALSQRHH